MSIGEELAPRFFGWDAGDFVHKKTSGFVAAGAPVLLNPAGLGSTEFLQGVEPRSELKVGWP